jgi:hypothetical protein
MSFERVDKNELTEYAKSIEIALELNKTVRNIDERKEILEKKGFELNYWNWRLTVGQIIKVTAGNSFEYNMKISSRDEYHNRQQVQAYVV